MNFNSGFKIFSSLLLIGGLLGFFVTTQNTLIHLGIFFAGLAMLIVAYTFDNAKDFDNWVKSWNKHGTKQ